MSNSEGKKKIDDFKDPEWIRASDFDEFTPISELFGVCFDSREQVLLCSKNVESPWQLPGGTVNKAETFEKALLRHFRVKTCIEIKNIQPLGIIKKTSDKNETSYEAIMLCEVHDMLPLVDDPETGKTWLQEFVSWKRVNTVITNEKLPQSLFKDAIELYKSQKKSEHEKESLTFLTYHNNPNL